LEEEQELTALVAAPLERKEEQGGGGRSWERKEKHA